VGEGEEENLNFINRLALKEAERERESVRTEDSFVEDTPCSL